MRPDKKKKVHHDSRKKAEKAKQTTLSEQGQTKESVEKVQDVVGAKVDDKDPPKDEKSIKGRSTKVVEEKPPKNISSNWTKFEIPSSDEDENEDTLTGLNFNFVLENKVDSSAQFRFKSEREWDEQQTVFTSEFFSLDLKVLEDSISRVPLQTILKMEDSEFDAATLARLHEEIARHKSRKVDQICSNETLKQKILDTLSGREKKPEDDSAKMSTEIDENDVLNSDEKDDEKEDVDVEKLLREVGSVQIGSSVAPTLPVAAPGETSAQNETKNLEDWLDEFLSD